MVLVVYFLVDLSVEPVSSASSGGGENCVSGSNFAAARGAEVVDEERGPPDGRALPGRLADTGRLGARVVVVVVVVVVVAMGCFSPDSSSSS